MTARCMCASKRRICRNFKTPVRCHWKHIGTLYPFWDLNWQIAVKYNLPNISILIICTCFAMVLQFRHVLRVDITFTAAMLSPQPSVPITILPTRTLLMCNTARVWDCMQNISEAPAETIYCIQSQTSGVSNTTGQLIFVWKGCQRPFHFTLGLKRKALSYSVYTCLL